LLEDLQEKRGLAYLFITHDIGVVQHIADRIAVMYLGSIVETGPAPTVLGEPAHPYTQLLLRAVPKIGVPLPEETGVPSEPASRRPQSGCAFAPRCPLADDTCRAAAPILKPSPRDPNHLTACFKA